MFLGHHGGSGEDHYQTGHDQQRRGKEHPLIHPYLLRHLFYLQFVHQFLEDPAAMLVAFKLVKAGASRRQHYNFASPRRGSRRAHRVLSVSRTGFEPAPRMRLDLRHRQAMVTARAPLTQQLRELGVIGVLVLAAQDQVNALRKCGDGFGHGVHVCSLRVVVVLDAVHGGNELQPVL